MLGFGVDVNETVNPPTVTFNTRKYTLGLVERFLKGEKKPDRSAPSRASIMDLPAEKAPEPGTPEALEALPMQDETRSLCGGLGHLSRGTCSVTFEHAWCAQGMANPTYAMREHLRESLRFEWAHVDDGGGRRFWNRYPSVAGSTIHSVETDSL